MKRLALWTMLGVAAGVGGAVTPVDAGSVSEVIADQAAAPEKPKTPNAATLSADMEATLKKAGFTDLKILPNSILVRAKDRTGRPVAMVLNPASMTEVVTLDPHSGSAAAGDGSKKPLTGSGTFPTVLPSARLGTTLIGLKVRTPDGRPIGTIKDLAIDHDGIGAYIVGVGGLLDGSRYVAVAPKAVEIGYDKSANAYFATMNATSDQLKDAPEFTYDGRFSAGRK